MMLIFQKTTAFDQSVRASRFLLMWGER